MCFARCRCMTRTVGCHDGAYCRCCSPGNRDCTILIAVSDGHPGIACSCTNAGLECASAHGEFSVIISLVFRTYEEEYKSRLEKVISVGKFVRVQTCSNSS